MEYRVPYADTDMMGYVYYGNYLTLFERSRNELMRATGYTYAEMEKEGGAMLPVVEAHVDYHAPARYDDLLTVRFRVGDVYKDAYVSVYFDDERVQHQKKRILTPGEMEQVILQKKKLASYPELKTITVRIEKE